MLHQNTINIIEKTQWQKIATREVSLFEVYTAAVAYTRFPFSHKMDSLVVVRNGMATRYGIPEQIKQLEDDIKTTQMSPIMEKCVRYDEKFNQFLDKNPFDNLTKFIEQYEFSLEGELLGYYVGAFSTDKTAIELSNKLRGIHNAQHRVAVHYLPQLFKLIADKYFPKDSSLVKFISPEEIVKEKMAIEELESRSRLYVMLTIQDKIELLYGKEVEDLINKVITEEEVVKVSSVQGSTAYLGKVSGIVKIVNAVADMAKVENGDILVSIMTRTNLISAMEKASAFVTDEGGVTCHAAIIARELKKPCIVGTKIATKIFKDGDLVEVDADSGVVKKIS